jgi:hypothetical protein
VRPTHEHQGIKSRVPERVCAAADCSVLLVPVHSSRRPPPEARN